MDFIIAKYEQIRLLSEKHHVANLYVFGSAVFADDFSDDSDIDFLVKFSEMNIEDYFENYITFKAELEKLFLRKIDLVEVQTIKNPILKRSINRTKRMIYGRAGSEVAV